jgi:hypothetical protein
MTCIQRLDPKGVFKLPPIEAAPPLAKRISSWGRRIGDLIETLADYYAAAAMYEQLSRLSDAELKRCGLSRQNLARVSIEACNRPQA